MKRLQNNTPFIIGCSSQFDCDHTSNSANHVELRQQNHGDQKLPTKPQCNTSTSVTSVDSIWEAQSWVHQQEELNQHVVIDFFTYHFCSRGKMQLQKTCNAKKWTFFPQIAVAIGVLTSNRGEGDEPLWRIGRGTRIHCRVQWTWSHCWCHRSAMVEGEGYDQLSGEWTWCHCRVPL